MSPSEKESKTLIEHPEKCHTYQVLNEEIVQKKLQTEQAFVSYPGNVHPC